MNKIKKYICLFTVLAIIAGCLPFCVFAADTGDLTVNSAGKITSCVSSASGELIIPETINGETVTAIGKEAFKGCNLSSVEIPATVNIIEDRAFFASPNLYSVKFKGTDVTFGNSVFAECDNLLLVTLPSQLKEIKANDFSQCHSLAGITFPETLTYIGDGAFESSGLTQVSIPSSIKTIVNNPFANCVNISAFYVDENNSFFKTDDQNILYSKDGKKLIAFPQNCGLTQVFIPESVETIVNNPFANCVDISAFYVDENNSFFKIDDQNILYSKDGKKLIAFPLNNDIDSFSLPLGVTQIGEFAFAGSSLSEILLNEGLQSIAPYAFKECANLFSITIPSTLSYFKNAFDDSNIYYLNLAEGYSVIEDRAFEKTNFSSITIPSSVTEVKEYAFYSCRNLKTVVFKGTDVVLGKNVFDECDNLSSVTLPSQLKMINECDFNLCNSLETISFPNTLTTIGKNAFNGSGLTQIEIPASVTSISTGAFSNCMNNAAFVVDSNNNYYRSDSNNCLLSYDGTKLLQVPLGNSSTSFIVSDGITEIGELSFSKNTTIKKVTLPPSVKEVGPYAFSECTALNEVNLNEGLEKIGTLAFKNCIALKKVTVPSTVTEFDSAFYNCGLTNVTLADGITAISRAAFDMCKDLVTVSIPTSVTTISAGAFKDCSSLDSLDLLASVTSIDKSAFLNIKDKIVLYVEDGSYAEQFAQENNIQFKIGIYRIVLNATDGTFADGSKLKIYRFKSGNTIDIAPEIPVRTGYTFTGWSSVLPETMPEESLNISAVWSINTYTVTTVINGEKTNYSFEYGEKIEIEAPDAPDGSAFARWTPSLPKTMPAQNITVTAVFTVTTKIYIEKNTKGEKTINIGDILKMNAVVMNPVEGGGIKWTASNGESKTGNSFSISPEKGTVTVTVTAVDADGRPVLDDNGKEINDTVKVSVNSGFFRVIISFFKNLFKIDRSVYLP